ncbi:MAG: dehydratase [Desulfobacula sp. GWF2_41_7]|nr:MAG: dehydratase [Desulfobacula sp. GWF2_41_7]
MATLEFENFVAFREILGKSLPKGEWVTVTQDMINAFAIATLDRQWIHIDVERAKKESPFRSTIAHGFLSAALISSMIGDLVLIKSMTMGVNYGLNNLRFPHPVPVDSRLRLVCRFRKIEDFSESGIKVFWNCELEIESILKPACICEFIALVFE